MKVLYRNQVCTIEKIEVYCKKGAYEHKTVKGWGLVNPVGDIVVGNRAVGGVAQGAYRFENPEYKTRKELLRDLVENKGAKQL